MINSDLESADCYDEMIAIMKILTLLIINLYFSDVAEIWPYLFLRLNNKGANFMSKVKYIAGVV